MHYIQAAPRCRVQSINLASNGIGPRGGAAILRCLRAINESGSGSFIGGSGIQELSVAGTLLAEPGPWQ